MEDQCSPFTWPYYYQQEGIEELKHYLLHTTLELEATIVSSQEEIGKKDDEIVHLKSLLFKIKEERDEALAKCKTLMLEKVLLQQKQQFQHINKIDAAPSSGTTSIEGESSRGESKILHSSSDCVESFVSSPGKNTLVDVTKDMVVKKPLPENGKFLQAVMEAGPLLQTLLLAGPLPQWEHPPPQLNTVDIPPVTIPSPTMTTKLFHHQDSCLSSTNGNNYFSKKRVILEQGFDSSPNSKYQRIVQQSSLINIV